MYAKQTEGTGEKRSSESEERIESYQSFYQPRHLQEPDLDDVSIHKRNGAVLRL